MCVTNKEISAKNTRIQTLDQTRLFSLQPATVYINVLNNQNRLSIVGDNGLAFGYEKTNCTTKRHINTKMSAKPPPLKTVSQEQKWTLFSSSQSLSAALNDPAFREYDFFTKTWGSYFLPNTPLPLPPTDLPKIELADFQRYIKETAAVSVCVYVCVCGCVCMYVYVCVCDGYNKNQPRVEQRQTHT